MKKIHLSIPKPCHEDWDQMTPAEKGKFCAACQKTVVDFTGMNDRELIAFFKKPAGPVCGRFHQDQLERDIVPPLKRIPWVKYFFQFTWPAFMLLFKSCGPKEKTAGRLSINTKEVREAPNNNPYEIATVGMLMANISLVDTTEFKEKSNSVEVVKGDVKQVCISDSMDEVSIDKPEPADTTRNISPEPFVETDTVVLSQNQLDTVVISCGRADTKRIVLGGVSVVKGVKLTSLPIDEFHQPGKIETAFTVYPNPVIKGTSIKINCQQIEQGAYTVLLISNAGQVIQSRAAEVEYKNQVLPFHLNDMAAGIYFIQFISRESGKSYTEKVVVL